MEETKVNETSAQAAKESSTKAAPAEKLISKELFDKTASELAEYKRKFKERMSEDEQAQQAQKETLERLAALEKENARMRQEKTLLAGGYDADTASNMASLLSEGDMDGFIKAQVSWMTSQKSSMEAALKQELMSAAPHAQTSAEATAPEVEMGVALAKAAAARMNIANSTVDAYK